MSSLLHAADLGFPSASDTASPPTTATHSGGIAQPSTARQLQLSTTPMQESRSVMHPVVHRALGPSGIGHPVSPDLLTRAFGSMLATPERDARAVGNRVGHSEDWVIVPPHGMVRVLHPHASPSRVISTGQPFSAASQDHLLLRRMQLQLELQQRAGELQQLQSQQILQILQQLVLRGPDAATAQDPEVMQLLALQEQERQLLARPAAPCLAVLDVVPTLSDVTAQPTRAARGGKRQIPQLKTLTSLTQFWGLWHSGAPLSGIPAVKALPTEQKNKERQRFSEWKKAVDAVMEMARAASNAHATADVHSIVNALEQERMANRESVRSLIIRLGAPKKAEHVEEG